MSLAGFSVKRSVTISMVILIIVVIGSIAVTRLGLDLLPDITYPVISVVTTYEGVGSEDIENLLTRPIETAVSTVKNVKNLTATSQEGLSAVMVEFEWGTNLDFAAQDIRDRIGLIKDFLPEDVSDPIVMKFDMTMIPVLVYGVTGSENYNLLTLRKIVKEILRDRLEQLDGIAGVMVMGGTEREIRISVDRKKLENYGIGLNQLIQKLKMENISLPSGRIEQGYTEYIIRTIGEFNNVEEIGNLVISIKNNVPVYLREIAQVEDATQEIRSYSRVNAKDAVLLVVSKESGANTVQVVDRVMKEMERLKTKLPKDINPVLVFDQARFIKRILTETANNAILGSILTILVLYLFLRNWRPTFTIALAIPLSIIVIFIPLYFLGYTLNFITLMGIALGVGMLVDNAIVVIENTFRHLGEGKSRAVAAEIGATEVGMAITSSTLTTIIVFVPLIFASGITGRIFRDMALSVTLSLSGSLFVALTIVPMIASKLFAKVKAVGYETESSGKYSYSAIRNWYKSMIYKFLKNKAAIIISVFLAFVLSAVIAIFFMGKEFFPQMDNNMTRAEIKLPVGTKLEETNRIVKLIENEIMKEKEVKIEAISLV